MNSVLPPDNFTTAYYGLPDPSPERLSLPDNLPYAPITLDVWSQRLKNICLTTAILAALEAALLRLTSSTDTTPSKAHIGFLYGVILHMTASAISFIAVFLTQRPTSTLHEDCEDGTTQQRGYYYKDTYIQNYEKEILSPDASRVLLPSGPNPDSSAVVRGIATDTLNSGRSAVYISISTFIYQICLGLSMLGVANSLAGIYLLLYRRETPSTA